MYILQKKQYLCIQLKLVEILQMWTGRKQKEPIWHKGCHGY